MKYALFIGSKNLKHRTDVKLPEPTELINGRTRMESQAASLWNHIPDHGSYSGSNHHASLTETFRGLN